jgi:hypothetical protein
MPGLAARATTISRAIPPSRDADSTKAYVGYGVASLYPTAEEARITCAIVDAAAHVRDLNFKYLAEGKGATVTTRFGEDGITICDPSRASEGVDEVFQRIYDRAL